MATMVLMGIQPLQREGLYSSPHGVKLIPVCGGRAILSVCLRVCQSRRSGGGGAEPSFRGMSASTDGSQQAELTRGWTVASITLGSSGSTHESMQRFRRSSPESLGSLPGKAGQSRSIPWLHTHTCVLHYLQHYTCKSEPPWRRIKDNASSAPNKSVMSHSDSWLFRVYRNGKTSSRLFGEL